MNRIQSAILIAATLLPCQRAMAADPTTAYGVSIVGDSLHCIVGVGLRCTNLGTTHPYILLGGYYSVSDGGGGYLALGPSGCTDNGGTTFKDLVGNCFYRMDDRAAVPVKWFGAKCDGATTVYGGTITHGTKTFSSTSFQFQSSDVGKVIELFAGGSVNPFQTKIDAVNVGANTATLHTAPYNDYPGPAPAKDARFIPVLLDGLDSPGSGYQPGDPLTVSGGTGTPATATVKGTGLVAFDISSGGSGFVVGDLITLNALSVSSTQLRPAQIQVASVSGGAVTGYNWIDYGEFQSANPTSFGAISNHGTGFAISLRSSNGSFGVSRVKLKLGGGGSYTALPTIPAQTTTTGSGTGATIDLFFTTPTWTYGTDDTTAFYEIENYLENDYDRGIFNAGELPGSSTCLLQTLTVQRPVTWRSSGSRQAQLMELLSGGGGTIDGTHYGFVLVAANLPSFDTYQANTVGQNAVSFNNIMIAGGTTSNQVDVEGSQNVAYTNNGLLFQNPTNKESTNVNGAFQNLQVVNFPGNAIAAYDFNGEFRGYNVFAGHSGGNCVDIENKGNPFCFFGLVAQGCTRGLNLVSTGAVEFHGASVFGNDINVYVSGTTHLPQAYIVFDNLQLGHSQNENMHLDQQNETVVCASNCIFRGMNESGATGGDSDSAIVVGPDAVAAYGQTNTVLRLNQGSITPDTSEDGKANYLDVRFDTNSLSNVCACSVALGDGMVNLANGTVSSNASGTSASLSGPITFGGPQAGPNANLNNGIGPINLSPSEIGMGVTTGTLTQAGKAGLKLSVQCGSNNGTAKLVVLAGTGTAQTLLDNIGSNVAACQQ